MYQRICFSLEVRKRCNECEDWLRQHHTSNDSVFNSLQKVRETAERVDHLQTELGGYPPKCIIRPSIAIFTPMDFITAGTALIFMLICWKRGEVVTASTLALLTFTRWIYLSLFRRTKEKYSKNESLVPIREPHQKLISDLVESLQESGTALRILCETLTTIGEARLTKPNMDDFFWMQFLQQLSFQRAVFSNLLTGIWAVNETLKMLNGNNWTTAESLDRMQLGSAEDTEIIEPVDKVLKGIKRRYSKNDVETTSTLVTLTDRDDLNTESPMFL